MIYFTAILITTKILHKFNFLNLDFVYSTSFKNDLVKHTVSRNLSQILEQLLFHGKQGYVGNAKYYGLGGVGEGWFPLKN